MQIITETLAAYDASLGPYGEIIRNGKSTGVTASIKGQRIRFRSLNTTQLVMSGPVTARTVEKFVESFWYWSKP